MDNYNDIQNALIDLYLNVKIRSSEELRDFTSEKLEDERQTLKDAKPLLLVDYIRTSVEILVSMRKDEDALVCGKEESVLNASVLSLKEVPKPYEEQLQKLEEEVRSHIRVTLPSHCSSNNN